MADPPDSPHDDDHGDGEDDTYYEMLAEQRATFRYQMPDPMLCNAIDQAIDRDVKWDLTIYVSGLAISGTLVSPSRWISEVGAWMEAAANISAAEVTKDIATRWEIDAIGRVGEKPAIVHMIDATVRSGGTVMATEVRWRGRVSAIDGWSFGRLTP